MNSHPFDVPSACRLGAQLRASPVCKSKQVSCQRHTRPRSSVARLSRGISRPVGDLIIMPVSIASLFSKNGRCIWGQELLQAKYFSPLRRTTRSNASNSKTRRAPSAISSAPAAQSHAHEVGDFHLLFGLPVERLGDQQTGAGLLVGALDAARNVYGFADGRETFLSAAADGAYHCVTVMKTDADVEIDVVHRLHVMLHAVRRAEHVDRCFYGAHRHVRRIVNAKNRHDRIADEFLDVAAVTLYRVGHVKKIPVQDEHQVIRRKLL